MRASAQGSTLFEVPLSGRLEIRPVVRAFAEALPDFGAMARRNNRLARLDEKVDKLELRDTRREQARSERQRAAATRWLPASGELCTRILIDSACADEHSVRQNTNALSRLRRRKSIANPFDMVF